MILEPGQALFEEALAPKGHDLPPGVEALGDRVIGPALGGQEDHLGADDLKMGSRICGSARLQHPRFLAGQERFRRDSFAASVRRDRSGAQALDFSTSRKR
jgi:hypothetical protein